MAGVNLSRMFGGGGGMGGQSGDMEGLADTSEEVNISSLALLKMLKHARAGIPMEIMGLMLGEFIDEYTVRVVDVFSTKFYLPLSRILIRNIIDMSNY